MQDPHQQGGHGHHHHDHHHEDHEHHESEHKHHHQASENPDVDREAEGEDRPHTPSYLWPPVAGRAQSDSGSDPSLQQSRSVKFDLPSPVGTSKHKSPSGRFDPYNNNEVTGSRFGHETQRGRSCLCAVMCVELFIFRLMM